MTRITAAITSRAWIKLPPTPPTKPRSHNTKSTARIVHNIIFSPFLISDYSSRIRQFLYTCSSAIGIPFKMSGSLKALTIVMKAVN
jgi:hypothetical protein